MVYIESENSRQTLEADLIILATGMMPYNPFEGIIGEKLAYIIGDANHVGKAQDAIRDGWQKALLI